VSSESNDEGALLRVASLAGIEVDSTMSASFGRLDPSAPADYRALAVLLASRWSARPPRNVGLGGGQGAGKSTLGRVIDAAGAHFGLRIAVLGLDDFYLSKARRRELAAQSHPLFEMRGPPGTHDIRGCAEATERLHEAGEVELPTFDKGLDDLGPSRCLTGPFDIVVLEGWCVGATARPLAELEEPINELERESDPQGSWRRAVNQHLATDYAEAWNRLDDVVYLEAPGLDAVRRWRLQQEETLPEARRLGRKGVDRFVAYYERITRSMLEGQSSMADVHVRLAEDHTIAALRLAARRD